MIKQLKRVTLAALLAFTASCQDSSQAPPAPVDEGPIASRVATRLKVRDVAGTAIPNAKVLIGSAADVPFSGNFLIADSSGELALPPAWVDAQPITVDAPGFVRATFLARAPRGHELRLRPLPPQGRNEIRGEPANFGPLKRDGFLDVALVFPAVTRGEILNFQISSLISPESDVLDLPMGQELPVPSNLAVPPQRETYMVPITFDKPAYRIYTPSPAPTHIVAIHGRFPLKQMVDEIRGGKSVFDALGLLEFKGAGVRDLHPASPPSDKNIPINEMTFNKKLRVQAPTFPPIYVMLALPLVESGDFVFPSDLKRVSSGQAMDLTYPANGKPGVILSVLRNASTAGGTKGASVDCFSAAIRPGNAAAAFDFLPIIRPPELRGATLVLDPPQAPATVQPTVTYALLSKVAPKASGGLEAETKFPAWEIFADTWVPAIDLPQFPETAPQPDPKFRWEVFFLGDEIRKRTKPRPRPLGPAALETVSHVTKNAVDL